MKNFLHIFFVLFFVACSGETNFDAMGIFESDELLISSEISGKIVEFKLKEGDTLTAGEVVGFIDNIPLKLQKESLEKEIQALNFQKIEIEKQLAPLKEEIATALREKERQERLIKTNSTTTKAYEDAISNLDILNKNFSAKLSTMTLNNGYLEEEIQKIKIEISLLEDKIQKSLIISPISGVVLEKYAYEGELSNAQKPLFKIANIETLRLKAYVIAPDLTRIKLGDTVQVFSDFGQEYREYQGTISYIASKAEFTPKTIMTKDERENLVYMIKIDVKNDGFLKIGSYGEVKLK